MKSGNWLGKVGYCVGYIRSSWTPPGPGLGIWRPLIKTKTLSPMPKPNPSMDPWKMKLQSNPCAFQFQRSLCSSSNISVIKSEGEFNAALDSIQDRSLPAILYFTAAWCGPCRFIAPIIQELSQKYPHVTTYKIDIDQEGLGSTLNELSVTAVPTLHFFKDGKKAASVVGADVAKLKQTVENLYGN